MKNIIIILLSAIFMFFLSVTAVYSQSAKKMAWGAKIGLNRSMISGEQTSNGKIGYVGTELYTGVFMSRVLRPRSMVAGEVIFSYTDDYHFVELPLHFKYTLRDNWHLFAGPKIDFLIDAFFEEYWEDFKAFGVSGDFGLQYLLNRKLFLEARYSRGLSKQINHFVFDILNGKRNTLRLGIGIHF